MQTGFHNFKLGRLKEPSSSSLPWDGGERRMAQPKSEGLFQLDSANEMTMTNGSWEFFFEVSLNAKLLRACQNIGLPAGGKRKQRSFVEQIINPNFPPSASG